MISNNNFRILSDREKSMYKYSRCVLCDCYPCESVIERWLVGKDCSDEDLPFHIREGWDKCFMRGMVRVECGAANVADGIGNDFMIDLKYKPKKDRFQIVKGYDTGKWEPNQPVFISAQTGTGKNYFIENRMLPYVRELNIKYRTDFKVLIISNRIALRWQMESRIKKGMLYRDSEYETVCRYKEYECADVITYQGFLNKHEQFQNAQGSRLSRYLFVICDESHFFTSDSMFNVDTEKILSAIVNTFKDAIRVYMTATPNDSFDYINEYEDKLAVLYHFRRNYDYLDINCYSSHDELKDLIADRVTKQGENWLVFIDNIEKCKRFQRALECYPDMKGKVFAVDAESKEDRDYQEMVYRERLNKDTKVLISTSVLDNGVNFRNIQNVVVSDISKTKVLQMVGRARVEKGDRLTVYLKRFDAQHIENRINHLHERQDDYHLYDLAEESKAYSDRFRDKYYHGSLQDWKNASHLFGRVTDSPVLLTSVPYQYYQNKIARSYVDKLVPIYKSILDEMRRSDKGQEITGQKYLEYQLSWFSKEYDRANDITLTDRNKSEDGLVEFLESHVTDGQQMFKDEQEVFRNEFTKLHDKAFLRRDKNLERSYGLKVINDILETHSINYRVESHEVKIPEGKRQCWTIVRFDRETGTLVNSGQNNLTTVDRRGR